MLQTIDDIVERLVREYDPDRIILFGSRAAGTAREDSDIDLLVLKETEDRPLNRRIQVERLLCDNSRAREWAGWKPEVTLEEGLRRTAEWVEGHLDALRARSYHV